MRSILEFALFAWVGISVVAVLVQLVRIARYKRATSSESAPPAASQESKAQTIDLNKRLGSSPPVVTRPADDAMASSSTAASTTAQRASQAAAKDSGPSTSFTSPPSFDAPETAAAPVARTEATQASPDPQPVSAQEPPAAPPIEQDTAAVPTEAAPHDPTPTLADLLAGVRLPWNLLPTVDQSREPSNDRVVLITSEGDPADIGIDVADELERLGFTIAPRGDDTAVATRDDQSLGLQIIEDPMAAEVDGTRRFPTATESSVALDIWIEVNASA